jgi:hypothetical protein
MVDKRKMTLQTKRFIEMSDIVALRFDCKHCGATLTLDARKNFSIPPRDCVNCKGALWEYEDATIDRAISGVIENIKLWQKLLNDPKRIAFSFLLEVKEEAIESYKKVAEQTKLEP